MTKINILQGIAPTFAESAYYYRQILATLAACLLSFSGGLTFGITAVLLPQLENDTSFPYDKSYDSWIASMSPLAMILGCLFSGSMSDGIGRRMGQIVLIVPFTIGWISMGFSNTNVVILIGRFLTGICTGAIRPNSMVYIGEVTDPKYRVIALFCPSAAIHLGSLCSHIVGKYVYWRTSCFLFALPTILCLVILMCLKESPLWLLSKGKIDRGTIIFREFRGNGDVSEKELAVVLQRIKEKADEPTFRNTLNIIFSKPFMKSMSTMFILFIAVQWCGINTLSFYAEQIFEKTFSGDIDAFMLMIGTDCIRVMGSVAVCVFAKVIPRKITFVSCCFIITFVLIGLVTYLYMSPDGLVWIAVTCMVVYLGTASVLTCISWSFVAEIFPAKVRGFGSGVCSGMSFTLLFISVKVTPEIISRFGDHVMYAGFAGITLFSGIILSFLIPDTNGKSLQDIEDEMYRKESQVQNTVNMEPLPAKPPV